MTNGARTEIEILGDCKAILVESERAVLASVASRNGWLPKEVAAQIAERTACLNIPNAEAMGIEYLDAWVAACETVATALREYQPVKIAGKR